jgi:Family of unknown function (DUF5367)
MNIRLFLCGLGIWMGATVALRVAGQHLLHPDNLAGTLILFAVSFPLMAWTVRRLCSRFQARREEWPAGAVSVALPTLLLDPFSSAVFPVVFPNMAPEVAGVFGGCACARKRGCCGAAQAHWWV